MKFFNLPLAFAFALTSLFGAEAVAQTAAKPGCHWRCYGVSD